MVCTGPKAQAALTEFFRPITRPGPIVTQKLPWFGFWTVSDNPSVVEEVVVVSDVCHRFELHHHGGAAVQASLRKQLSRIGFCERPWQDWIATGEADPIRNSALAALPSVLTRRGASLLLDQYHGALRMSIQRIRQMLQDRQLDLARQEMLVLSQRSAFGLRLCAPWKVTFTGPPNVGKSSLLNAILGFGRAIVTDVPGTTRDVVTELTALDGWPVLLADTAGIRLTPDNRTEAIGMVQAEQELLRADVVIQVRERGGVEFTPLDTVRVPILRVTNKSDLMREDSRDRWADELEVSAKTRDRLGELAANICKLFGPNPPQSGVAVPFIVEQVQAIRTAILATEQGDAAGATHALEVFG